MGSKRRQDILLILSGLQKVANSAVKQEMSGLDKSRKKVSAIKNAVTKNISESSSIDPNLLVKRSGLVLENTAYMTQALTATTLNESIKHFGYEKAVAKTDNRSDGVDKNLSAHDQDFRDLVKVAGDDELDLYEKDYFDDHLPPILELNPSVTSLVRFIPQLIRIIYILKILFLISRDFFRT